MPSVGGRSSLYTGRTLGGGAGRGSSPCTGEGLISMHRLDSMHLGGDGVLRGFFRGVSRFFVGFWRFSRVFMAIPKPKVASD